MKRIIAISIIMLGLISLNGTAKCGSFRTQLSALKAKVTSSLGPRLRKTREFLFGPSQPINTSSSSIKYLSAPKPYIDDQRAPRTTLVKTVPEKETFNMQHLKPAGEESLGNAYREDGVTKKLFLNEKRPISYTKRTNPRTKQKEIWKTTYDRLEM